MKMHYHRYPTGATRRNYILPPFSRLTMTFNSLIPSAIRAWNELDFDLKETKPYSRFKSMLRKTMLSTKNKLYSLSASKAAVNHTRIRMGLSALNAQRFDYNLIDYKNCQCGSLSEDPVHFFINCPLYTAPRQILLGDTEHILIEFSLIIEDQPNILNHNVLSRSLVNLFMFGNKNLSWDSNVNLFQYVQNYIDSSHRFA